jgi:hypothetical protein
VSDLQCETGGGAASADLEDGQRIEALERRLRKTKKEREHLWRELERRRAGSVANQEAVAAEGGPSEAPPGSEEAAPSEERTARPIGEDPNPRRRVLRQMLRSS